jgi:hypothetical protein
VTPGAPVAGASAKAASESKTARCIGALTADDIFHSTAAILWPSSEAVLPIALAALPLLESHPSALVKLLANALADRDAQLATFRAVLSEASAHSHRDWNEIRRLKRRVADLLEQHVFSARGLKMKPQAQRQAPVEARDRHGSEEPLWIEKGRNSFRIGSKAGEPQQRRSAGAAQCRSKAETDVEPGAGTGAGTGTWT